ncbi:MAG: hypothetical protein A2W35_02665 [Chloroflexi bacterium RBG_16_57_11]|nr:MAG: hypothetical protein A2W35_02665 [Chloroflexi bacterium RBG_16_57_11]
MLITNDRFRACWPGILAELDHEGENNLPVAVILLPSSGDGTLVTPLSVDAIDETFDADTLQHEECMRARDLVTSLPGRPFRCAPITDFAHVLGLFFRVRDVVLRALQLGFAVVLFGVAHEKVWLVTDPSDGAHFSTQ